MADDDVAKRALGRARELVRELEEVVAPALVFAEREIEHADIGEAGVAVSRCVRNVRHVSGTICPDVPGTNTRRKREVLPEFCPRAMT